MYTECKVHILLLTDLVTVTKLPANLSKSSGEYTRSICGRGYSILKYSLKTHEECT